MVVTRTHKGLTMEKTNRGAHLCPTMDSKPWSHILFVMISHTRETSQTGPKKLLHHPHWHFCWGFFLLCVCSFLLLCTLTVLTWMGAPLPPTPFAKRFEINAGFVLWAASLLIKSFISTSGSMAGDTCAISVPVPESWAWQVVMKRGREGSHLWLRGSRGWKLYFAQSALSSRFHTNKSFWWCYFVAWELEVLTARTY